MRAGLGWAAAAALVAACGNGATAVPTSGNVDEHQGRDQVCGVCSVQGSGQFTWNGAAIRFEAAADHVAAPAAGYGGVGWSASGYLRLHGVPAAAGGPDLSGAVDTIVSCDRVGGLLRATVSGTMAGERFTAVVTDGGATGSDTVALAAPRVIEAVCLDSGSVQVSGSGSCHPICGEGLCWCHDELQCESCASANAGDPAPPPCLEGTCWDAQRYACAPCMSPAPPPPPPAAPPPPSPPVLNP